jgi:hypothetical protein
MCASLAAGPVYLTACAAAAFLDAIPQPVLIAPAAVVRFLISLIPGIIGGFFAAMIPLGLAIVFLSAGAHSWRALRAPPLWTVAGAAAGALIAWKVQTDEWVTAFALICTGAVSLRLARAYLAWPPPEPLPLIRPARVSRSFSEDRA